MHLFSAAGVDYGLAEPELGSLDERWISLDRRLAKPGDRMRCTHDFARGIVRLQLEIATRLGTVHSYTLFTGYFPRRIRGEMRAFQVLGNP